MVTKQAHKASQASTSTLPFRSPCNSSLQRASTSTAFLASFEPFFSSFFW